MSETTEVVRAIPAKPDRIFNARLAASDHEVRLDEVEGSTKVRAKAKKRH